MQKLYKLYIFHTRNATFFAGPCLVPCQVTHLAPVSGEPGGARVELARLRGVRLRPRLAQRLVHHLLAPLTVRLSVTLSLSTANRTLQHMQIPI